MTQEDELDALLIKLQQQDGKLWARILGQDHSQYGEIPFWVLVENSDQIRKATEFLQRELLEFQQSHGEDITVSFMSRTADKEYSYGMFKGEEFFDVAALDNLYPEPVAMERTKGIFDYAYPDDEGALK